jgi:hypothetical protein
VELVTDENEAQQSAAGGYYGPYFSSSVQTGDLDSPGPNFPNPSASNQLNSAVVWIVWSGSHITDCAFVRRVKGTFRQRMAGLDIFEHIPPGVGFQGMGASARDGKGDGPQDWEVVYLSDSVAIVSDAPGQHSLQPGQYPVSAELNFYMHAYSKTSKAIKGTIEYDMGMFADGAGEGGAWSSGPR